MRRREFLTAAALALAAGCRRPVVAPPGGLTPADEARIAAATEARRQHLALLERHRVPATATRTTPPPSGDILGRAPELKGLTRVAVRLHPRYGDEPGITDSKLGGRFAWPASEPWPNCTDHGSPLVTVLQLRHDDAPPQFPVKPGTDLLQLLWCPRDHGPGGGPKPHVVWRAHPGKDLLPAPPPNELADPGFVPVPCRVFPERLAELPPPGLLPDPVREKLAGLNSYDRSGPCPGTKVSGYPFGASRADVTACERCRRPTDFLLAIAEREWDGESWQRWMPEEERAHRGDPDAETAFGRAAGLSLPGSKRVNVFVCTRCDGWPVRVV